MEVSFGKFQAKNVCPTAFLDLMHLTHKRRDILNRGVLQENIDKICELLNFTSQKARDEVQTLFGLKYLRLMPWCSGWCTDMGDYNSWLISNSTDNRNVTCALFVRKHSEEGRCLKRMYKHKTHLDHCAWSESESEPESEFEENYDDNKSDVN